MRDLPKILLVGGLGMGLVAAPVIAGDLDSRPGLKTMLAEIRDQLELTDGQVTTARGLIEGQIDRARAVVEELDEFTFDSVLDLLVEARSIREEFIPQLRGLLDERQLEKLDALPKSSEIYIQGMVGWIVEERVDKLRDRLGLESEQIDEIREVITDQIRDSVEILEGIDRGEDSSRRDMLDAVMDLRGAQRSANRQIGRLMTDDQKSRFEELIGG
jgi:hypothetical protein